MAKLAEGNKYGLSSNIANFGDKTVVHLKLTDTASKAIDEYLKHKNGMSGQHPTLQFEGNKGFIEFPVRSTLGGEPQDPKTFRFTLAVIQGDPNGSFDCIQQISRNPGDSQLDSLGSMLHKMTVHATDDVYQTTREKMTIAEEESKKLCTKEIKPSGPNIGHRIKKVIKNGSHHHSSLKSSSSNKQSLVNGTSHRQTTNSVNNYSSSHSPPIGISRASTPSPKPLPFASNVKGSSNGSKKNNYKQNPVYHKPYRERIIHLLAVRSYKRPELLLRLQKDGIKDKDKNLLGSILTQLAVLNTKDNQYSLTKHFYSEVKVDWPFYSQSDKQLLQKKLQLDNQSAVVSPASSPAPTSSPASNNNPESPNNSQKRGIGKSLEPQPTKKARISHYIRKENREVNGMPHLPTLNSTPVIRKDKQDENDYIRKKEPAEPEMPDYLCQYSVISNTDQRQKYKHDFNLEFEEYLLLHVNVQKVCKKFADLDLNLKKTLEGTEEYENLKRGILKEYMLQKGDPKFIDQKKRFEYLHHKLAHIKKLIIDYDQPQTARS